MSKFVVWGGVLLVIALSSLVSAGLVALWRLLLFYGVVAAIAAILRLVDMASDG